MTLEEAIEKLAKRFPSKKPDLDFTNLATPFVNDSYLEVGKSWDWPELDTYGSIVAEPIVEKSVTVAAGDYTVAVSGADSAWRGWFFRKKGGDNEYRILRVSGGVLTLDQALIESGSIDAEIEKRFYPIPAEVRKITSFENRPFLTQLDNNAMRQHMPGYRSVIADNPFSVHGSDEFTEDYASGTLTASADSNVVTGSGGTLWLANARAGNIIRFNSVNYRVRRAEADDRLILYNKVPQTSAVAYAIKQDAAKTVRMRGKFTTKKIVPFQYIRSVYKMVHKDDEIDLGEEATIAVLDFADAGISSGPLRQDDWAARLLRAQARLERAQALSNPVQPAFKMFPPLIPGGLGRG